MYVPAHFALTQEQQADALDAVAFGHLVTPTARGLVSTPLPLVHRAGSLLCHVARPNDHWTVQPTGDSLVVVAGPDGYVSPGLYPSKADGGRVVPTWNYEVLHVHGRLVVHDDVDWLRELVTALTDRFEASRPEPWQVTDAPAAYVDGMLRAIVGLELQVTRIEGKAKLSQNRSADDQRGVIAGLAGTAVAARMSARMSAGLAAEG